MCPDGWNKHYYWKIKYKKGLAHLPHLDSQAEKMSSPFSMVFHVFIRWVSLWTVLWFCSYPSQTSNCLSTLPSQRWTAISHHLQNIIKRFREFPYVYKLCCNTLNQPYINFKIQMFDQMLVQKTKLHTLQMRVAIWPHTKRCFEIVLRLKSIKHSPIMRTRQIHETSRTLVE